MQNFDVKHGLVNYRAFQNQVIELLNQIEAIEAKQNKTGGSVIKIQDRSNDHREMFMLDCIEKKDKIRKKIDRYMYYLDLVNNFICCLPIPYNQMIKEKYVLGDNQALLSEKYNYSPRQILNIVDKYVDRYIDVT